MDYQSGKTLVKRRAGVKLTIARMSLGRSDRADAADWRTRARWNACRRGSDPRENLGGDARWPGRSTGEYLGAWGLLRVRTDAGGQPAHSGEADRGRSGGTEPRGAGRSKRSAGCRKKNEKLIVAFHFWGIRIQPGGGADECRRNRLEQKRRCGWWGGGEKADRRRCGRVRTASTEGVPAVVHHGGKRGLAGGVPRLEAAGVSGCGETDGAGRPRRCWCLERELTEE